MSISTSFCILEAYSFLLLHAVPLYECTLSLKAIYWFWESWVVLSFRWFLNTAFINRYVSIVWISVWIFFFEWMPVSFVVGPYGKYMFKCIGNCRTVFLSVCTGLRSCQQTGKFQLLSFLASTLWCPFFAFACLVLVILEGSWFRLECKGMGLVLCSFFSFWFFNFCCHFPFSWGSLPSCFSSSLASFV